MRRAIPTVTARTSRERSPATAPTPSARNRGWRPARRSTRCACSAPDGTGTVEGVVNALKWVLANHVAKNIRVVNLSFGMKPSGSLPDADPLATMLDPDHGDPLAIWTKDARRRRRLRRRRGRQRRPGRLLDAAAFRARTTTHAADRQVRCVGRHHGAGHVPVGVHGGGEQLGRQLHPRRRRAREVQLARSRVPASEREARHPGRRRRHRVDGGAQGSTLYNDAAQSIRSFCSPARSRPPRCRTWC